MADLVTIEEAKLYLRVDSDDDDDTIAILIAAASDAVRDVASDWDGEGEVPDRLKLAVLTRIAVTYDNRTSAAPGTGETVMLTPLRKLEV
ncbi:MAG: head-tail connector protein [Xanthobacteraceae bacterium]